MTSNENNELFQQIHNFVNSKDDEEKPRLLEDKEIETLILSLGVSRGEDGFTEEEAEKVVRWAEMARLNEILLSFVLEEDYRVYIGWEKEEPTFVYKP